MIPPEVTASQPIPTGKRHKYHLPPGYSFPDPADIFPCELSNADERRVLFVDAMFKHGQKSWWQRSKRLNAVHRYCILKARSPCRRFHLDHRALQSVATTVHGYCCQNLSSGRTQHRFSEIQASRGRHGGYLRRSRTAERDAEIVERVTNGEAKKALAREYGITAAGIRYVCSRGLWADSAGGKRTKVLNHGYQEDVVWEKTGLDLKGVTPRNETRRGGGSEPGFAGVMLTGGRHDEQEPESVCYQGLPQESREGQEILRAVPTMDG